jgi:DNA invertase Pin-like site-specific DNA recombinase
MIAYGYCRVSTAMQADRGGSLEAQEAAIRGYAEAHALGDPRVFVDPATSGKLPFGDRPAGGELLDRIRPGDHLIVTRIDRGWRSLLDFLECFEVLNRKDICLHVIDFGGNQIDPRTSIGKLVFRILAVVAELEREMIGDRIRSSIRHQRSLGIYHSPRSAAAIGFTAAKAPGGKGFIRVPDVEARKLMAQMLDWHESGWSCEQISRHLNASGVRPFTKDHKKVKSARFHPMMVSRILQAERKYRLEESQGIPPEQPE